jgi:hypothetical protein
LGLAPLAPTNPPEHDPNVCGPFYSGDTAAAATPAYLSRECAHVHPRRFVNVLRQRRTNAEGLYKILMYPVYFRPLATFWRKMSGLA